ncbi:MAG: aminotransferase class IV [Lewinella sp.]|nr:aminotransferase class IV [Lewinella sp.]
MESLRLVEIDGLNYRYKFADRRALEDAFSRREGCDEVIIVWRGYLTDATYANLALFDGQHWWTPAHPLLKGVRRSSLLAEGRIRPAVIRAADLKLFKEIKLINAMLSLKDTRGVPVSKVLAPGQAW